MARKTLISPAVIGSDAFLELQVEARELYFHLLVEADPIGTVANAMQVARGCGHGDPKRLLDALADAGYLIEAEARDGGRVFFISHWFEHNRHDRKREGASAYLDVANRLLDDPFAPYRKRVDGKATTIDGKATTIDAQCNAMEMQRNGNSAERNAIHPNSGGGASEPNPTHLNASEGGSVKGGTSSANCPSCGGAISEGGTVGGFSHVSCCHCGFDVWLDRETGETRSNPYAPDLRT